jgi:hypothetical protein
LQSLLAPDTFKGTFSTEDICAGIAGGIRSAALDVELIIRPMADGGEGTLGRGGGVPVVIIIDSLPGTMPPGDVKFISPGGPISRYSLHDAGKPLLRPTFSGD